MDLIAVDIMDDDGTEEQGAALSADAIRSSDMSGAIPVGKVTADGDRAVVIVAYPAADVATLNTSSLGSAVRNTLLSVV